MEAAFADNLRLRTPSGQAQAAAGAAAAAASSAASSSRPPPQQQPPPQQPQQPWPHPAHQHRTQHQPAGAAPDSGQSDVRHPGNYHNDRLYSIPRARATWERTWSYRHGRYETWADVINRLKRELGCMFVEGWQRACDMRDGRDGATYDPTRAPPRHQPSSFYEDFSRDFIAELAANDYDIRNLAWNRHLRINWNAVWDAQEARASDAMRKGGGKRGAPDSWPSGPPARARGL